MHPLLIKEMIKLFSNAKISGFRGATVKSEKAEILKNIESISLIKDEKIDKNLKWEKLKKYILWASSKEVKIGSSIIELINLIIKTSN